MGKGRIITAHGEGRYTLEILEDRARAESNRAMAAQRVAELDQRIEAAQAKVETLQQTVDDAAQEQNLAIALHQQQLADDGESDVDLAAYAVAVMEAAANRDRKRIEIGQMQADRLALQTRIERIDALPPLRQVDAWCADYTEDLEGEVATAEVPGEVGQVIIKPGFDGNTWSASTDGAIQPALSGTPAGVFYNLAMLPGWQKWRPTFRIATISNINNDLCDITLTPAASSQQGLNVNMASAYDGVPIMYMDCGGAAFADGDRVLVGFSGDASAPVVVGFEKEPKECADGFSTWNGSSNDPLWPDYYRPFFQTDRADFGEMFTVSKRVRINNIFGRIQSTTMGAGDFGGIVFCWFALYLCEGVTPTELLIHGRMDEDLAIRDQLIESDESVWLEPGKRYFFWMCPEDNDVVTNDTYGFSLEAAKQRYPLIEDIIWPEGDIHKKWSYRNTLFSSGYGSRSDPQKAEAAESRVYQILGEPAGFTQRIGSEEPSGEGPWVCYIGLNFGDFAIRFS